MTSNDFFERLEAQFQNKLPFVAYRKPNQGKVYARLQQDSSLNFTKDFTEKGFVFSPFDAAENTVLIPNVISEVITSSFEKSDTSDTIEKESKTSTESKEFHINLVKQGVEAIKYSDLKKVVLSNSPFTLSS